MQITVSKKILLILILWFFTRYSVYITREPEKFTDLETQYKWIWKINSKIRETTWYLIWKTNETTSKTKDIYNDKVVPKVDNIKTWVQWWFDSTKQRIDSVRKTLSWAEDTYNKTKEVINDGKETLNKATEVLNDIDKMWNAIINSVNTWTVSETLK